MSVDVNSMYPLLGMVSFNMSPETYIEPHLVPAELQDVLRKYYNSQDETSIINLSKDIKEVVTSLLQKYNIGLGINGACFKNDHVGIIPKTVRNIYLSRKDKQKLLKKNQSIQIKIDEILRHRLQGV
jgi:DNA polymerase elongation subunit (family B)